MADEAQAPCIFVVAGTNGAGKSSILGAMLLERGADYFDPDEAARLILSHNPGITQVEANSAAWHEGRRLLERAIWYVGLDSPDLHILRVRSRVERGGHDIPESRIRERYDQGRLNLIRLLPILTELFVYDNSTDTDPHSGIAPEPKLILHCIGGSVSSCDLELTPDWAKPIVAAAMNIRK